MEFTAHKISAYYAMEFAPPVFGLFTLFGRLIAKIHEKVSIRYTLPLSEIEGLPGPAINEIGLKLSLFNRNMVIHCQPGGYQVEAQNLSTDDDIAKVIDAIELTFSAFFEFCHGEKLEVNPGKTSLRVNAWFQPPTPDMTAVRVRQMINSTMPSALSTLLKTPSDSIHFYPNFHIDRASQNYAVDYLIQESSLTDGGAYATLTVTTRDANKCMISPLATILREELTRALGIVGIAIPLPRAKS